MTNDVVGGDLANLATNQPCAGGGVMMTYLPLIAALAGLGWVQADPDRELTAWAVLRGVDPAIVHAVARIETGNVPPDRRDSVVSRTGDVGRLQINAGFWCPKLGMNRGPCIEWLSVRRNNYALGTAILARIQAKYGGRGLTDCRCSGSHGGGWIAHYNGGHTVREGSRAERYGMKVIQYSKENRGLWWLIDQILEYYNCRYRHIGFHLGGWLMDENTKIGPKALPNFGQSFWQPQSIEHLAQEQGIKPISSLNEIRSMNLEDSEADALIEEIQKERALRRKGLS